jgi:pimeloyl-ACP methyl ester carboxylesterase
MKSIKLTFIFLFFFQFINAQFEDRFYFPKKECKEVKIPFSEDYILVENDTVHVAFFQPKKTVKATILFFHGAGGNISTYMYMIGTLVENGYQVFAVDFRGYGKSSGKPTHLNITKDVEIVFNKMRENKAIKNTKLIVYGASLGCQIATHFTNIYQNEVDGLILDGGFASFADVAKLYAPKETHLFIESALGNVYPSKEEIKEIKKVPKLIIHGKNDKSIPINQSEIVYKNALKPKEFFISAKGHLEALTFETETIISKINTLITVQ